MRSTSVRETGFGVKGRRFVVAFVAGVTLVALAGNGLPVMADPVEVTKKRPAVAGAPVTAVTEARAATSEVDRTARAMETASPQTAAKPTGAAVVDMAVARRSAAGLAGAGELPVRLGDASAPAVRQAGAKPAGEARASLGRVKVSVASSETARALGAGVVFQVDPVNQSASPTTVEDGAVSVEIDYSELAKGFGGDWASRVALVSYPGCAATTPTASPCRTGSSLGSANDVAAGTVTAVVPMEQTTMVALTSGSSSTSGDFGATPLSSVGEWGGGGNNGEFTWSYPFDVPEVGGSLVPELALGYSSSSVDGRATSTNNQPSWVGEGWDLSQGFIERRYTVCADDMAGSANNSTKTGDLCWAGHNAVLAFGSHSGELIRDGSSSQWRLRNDDGTRVELLTAAWDNGDNDREHWKVTTTDGTQYFFGRGKPHASGSATDSVWTVPVAGNHPGGPVPRNRVLRLLLQPGVALEPRPRRRHHRQLDDLFYVKELNRYGRNLNATSAAYVRGGHLARIEYGTRTGSEGHRRPRRGWCSARSSAACLRAARPAPR